MSDPIGEVFDLGYQHYDGPREGRMRSRTALWVNGVRTALGLGRGPRAKILPTLLFVAAMGPAIILTLVASVAGAEQEVPGHAGYYQIVSIILLLFAAIIAPELLCPDRRNRVLDLYLVRPLTPVDYAAARWLAFFSIILALVYSGQIVLLIGLVLAANDPIDYVRVNWLDVPRVLGAGAILAIFITTLPLAVSAFTTRRVYAAAIVIGLFVISAATAGSLTECQEEHGGASNFQGCERPAGKAARWLALVDIGQVPSHVNRMIFADDAQARASELSVITAVRELNAAVPIGWYILMTAMPGFLLIWRYQSHRL